MLNFAFRLILFLLAFQLNAQAFAQQNNDSITFEIQMPGQTSVGFNIYDDLLGNSFLAFTNKELETEIVKRKIPRYFSNSLIFYAFFDREKGLGKITYQYFLVDSLDKVLKFSFSNNRLHLTENKYSAPLSELPDDYERLSSNMAKIDNKEALAQDLRLIYEKYSAKYKGTVIGELNKYYYYHRLQRLYPLNSEVERFIKQINKPIGGEILRNLLYDYVKDRASNFNDNFIPSSNTLQFINLMALGAMNFLEHENHRGDESYNGMMRWLSGTDVFQKNEPRINERIQPLNKIIFKEKLSDIRLLDQEFKPIYLSSLLEKESAKIILIDFWATWCKPCIEGMRLMENMQLPPDVVIFNISIDKNSTRDKWLKSPLNDNKRYTYLLDQKELKNKQFIEFIKLQAIPRYVLIDGKGNLINESFYAPHENSFLEKLTSMAKGNSK